MAKRRKDAGQAWMAIGMEAIIGILGLDRGCLHSKMRQVQRAAGAAARTRGEQGEALAEFAVALPLLMMVLLGVIFFGITMTNYLMLTNATALGAEGLATINVQPSQDPCTYTAQQVYNAAPRLTQANLNFTIAINGTTVYGPGNAPSCQSSEGSYTGSNPGPQLVAGEPSSVTVTYPCSLNVAFIKLPNCKLTAQVTEVIQ
jgi:Flp pilus assembly protein TadG